MLLLFIVLCFEQHSLPPKFKCSRLGEQSGRPAYLLLIIAPGVMIPPGPTRPPVTRNHGSRALGTAAPDVTSRRACTVVSFVLDVTGKRRRESAYQRRRPASNVRRRSLTQSQPLSGSECGAMRDVAATPRPPQRPGRRARPPLCRYAWL